MKIITVDTNAFLRFLLDDIREQAETVEGLFKNAKKGKYKLLVPQIVIFEIEFTLRKYYHFSKEEITEKIEPIIDMSYLNIQNKPHFRKAFALFKANNLSLADCFIFAYSQDKNAELFTFDKGLKKLGKTTL